MESVYRQFSTGASVFMSRRVQDLTPISAVNLRRPPMPLIYPVSPSQCICADNFHYKGQQYFIIVDRYSNWSIGKRAKDGAAGFILSLREEFITFGIPEDICSDGAQSL